MLASERVGGLSDVDWDISIFSPEFEETRSHSKRSTKVMDFKRLSLREFLKDGLEAFAGLKFFRLLS